MDAHDKVMIDHIRTWIHFDGADEDIFPEFGIRPFELYHRVHHLLDGVHARDIPAPERHALQVFCREKMASANFEGRRSYPSESDRRRLGARK